MTEHLAAVTNAHSHTISLFQVSTFGLSNRIDYATGKLPRAVAFNPRGSLCLVAFFS